MFILNNVSIFLLPHLYLSVASQSVDYDVSISKGRYSATNAAFRVKEMSRNEEIRKL